MRGNGVSNLEHKMQLPDDFSGTVRLFPLPNLVVFPHVVQPLHIFEPRYCEMVEDALVSDQLIAMALLQPGWEGEYDQQPAIFPVACLGRILSHTRLPDGQFNILLMGLRRASVVSELPRLRAFRQAEVAILEDLYIKSGTQHRAALQRDLLKCFRQFTPESPAAQEQFESLMSNRLPLGVLADIIGFTMKFDLDFKQRLLSEWNVDVRAQLLLDALRTLTEANASDDDPDSHPFPPEFSTN